MARKTLNQPIRGTDPGNFALFDQMIVSAFGVPVAPAYSPGAQLVISVPPVWIPDNPWKILGYGFMFQGSLFNIKNTLNSVPTPCFAKLGRLYGGLVINGALSEGVSAFRQLPTDRSLLDLLWDGRVDPPWPQATSQNPFAAGAQSLQVFSRVLPTPIDAEPSDEVQIGLWLTPMLGQNVGIWITNAAYTILYDNGQ